VVATAGGHDPSGEQLMFSGGLFACLESVNADFIVSGTRVLYRVMGTTQSYLNLQHVVLADRF
jgi:hypothetical protein